MLFSCLLRAKSEYSYINNFLPKDTIDQSIYFNLTFTSTFLLAKNQDLVFKLPETNWYTDYETSVGEYKMTEMTKDGETIDGAIFGPMIVRRKYCCKRFCVHGSY